MSKIKLIGLAILIIIGFVSCAQQAVPTAQSDVGYEIFVYSFYDSDGDGIGDLNGVTAKLDYIKSLGVDLIWLMPIFKAQSYHGYDVIDYDEISPVLGTKADFEKLCSAAHQRGLRLILDLPMNHTSIFHPWFQKSANKDPALRDWYVWEDKLDGKPWISFYSGGPWTLQNGAYYYSIFWKEMPDLNFKNKQIREEFKSLGKKWLNAGADGFRLDGARYIVEDNPGWDLGQADSAGTLQWWKEFGTAMRAFKPGTLLVGEVWAPHQSIENYFINGQGFDKSFDFDFASAMVKSINQGNRKYLNMYLKEKRTVPLSYYAPFWGNHDLSRSIDSVGRSIAKAKLGFGILLTQPGTPFIYYGEEIGMVDAPAWVPRASDPDPQRRSPMAWDSSENGGFTSGKPWKLLAATGDPWNVLAMDKNPVSLLNQVRRLTALRATFPLLASGGLELLSCKESAIGAYLRRGTTDGILVMYNLSGNSITTEIQLTGSSLPENVRLENQLGQGDIAISKENYAKLPLSFQPYELKIFHVNELLPAPSETTVLADDQFQTRTLIVDNRANNLQPVYLFGTFDRIDGGSYKENAYGDVVENGYKMFDDGKHNDGAASDNIWGLEIKLRIDYDDPYIVKFGLSGSANGEFLGSGELNIAENLPKLSKFVVAPRITKQAVTLVFRVDMRNADAPSIIDPGIRGTLTAANKWNTHLPVADNGLGADEIAGDGIFTGQFMYPKGEPAYIEYKFNKDNAKGWETDRPNRTWIVDSSTSVNVLPVADWNRK